MTRLEALALAVEALQQRATIRFADPNRKVQKLAEVDLNAAHVLEQFRDLQQALDECKA